jgi:hypothetical protein
VADKKHLFLVQNFGNQPVFVSADVKHDELAYAIRGPINGSDVGESPPFGMFGMLEPLAQRSFRVGMNFPKFTALPARDNVH